MATVEFITTTGHSTWTVPAGVTSIKVECIGGGGTGENPDASAHTAGSGAAGGSYAKTNAISVTPGQTIDVSVGIAATQTWFNTAANSAPTSTATGCLAKGGASATASQSPGIGSTTGNIGDVVFAGGSGGTSGTGANSNDGGGGGGAGGPDGAGINGVSGDTTTNRSDGGASDAGLDPGGVGGNGAASPTAGGAGTLYTATAGGTAGPGGGGGGAQNSGSVNGRAGGLYGGGGSGAAKGGGTGGAGAQGLIVLTYTAAAVGGTTSGNFLLFF